MKQSVFFLWLTLLSPIAFAESTICSFKDNFDFDALEWDNDTGVAKLATLLGREYVGRVSLVRKHNDGEKVNLIFHLDESHYGTDAYEIIVFPAGDEFRTITVGYIDVEGKLYFDSFPGNTAVNCVTI